MQVKIDNGTFQEARVVQIKSGPFRYVFASGEHGARVMIEKDGIPVGALEPIEEGDTLKSTSYLGGKR